MKSDDPPADPPGFVVAIPVGSNPVYIFPLYRVEGVGMRPFFPGMMVISGRMSSVIDHFVRSLHSAYVVPICDSDYAAALALSEIAEPGKAEIAEVVAARMAADDFARSHWV